MISKRTQYAGTTDYSSRLSSS